MPATPISESHLALGARFTDFGGWEMPLHYSGVIAEHMAVRSSVGVFDVSHLGRFQVSGPEATQTISTELCNNIEKAAPGRAQYTMALNDRGGVVDDIIVWRFGESDYWVMPNGVNFDDLLERFTDRSGVTVTPLRADTVLLAVQGPDSIAVVEQVVGIAPGRFRVRTGEFAGGPVWLGGTGYTGERGAEIAVPAATGAKLFGALLDMGAVACGLGARDTLRLEMGYPLWGQDLDESTTPLEAGLDWVVDWNHDFVGKAALERQQANGLERALVAFRMSDRRPPRHGYRLRSRGATGVVTSGNFSPLLEAGIGMGYVAPPIEQTARLEIEVRDIWQPVEQVQLPFVGR